MAISYKQMEAFAGNMLELKDRDGARYLAMSNTAFNALLPGQLNEISIHRIPPPPYFSMDGIETGSGNGELVGGGLQIRNAKETRLVGLRGAVHAGRDIAQRNIRVGHHGSAGIVNRAAEFG